MLPLDLQTMVVLLGVSHDFELHSYVKEEMVKVYGDRVCDLIKKAFPQNVDIDILRTDLQKENIKNEEIEAILQGISIIRTGSYKNGKLEIPMDAIMKMYHSETKLLIKKSQEYVYNQYMEHAKNYTYSYYAKRGMGRLINENAEDIDQCCAMGLLDAMKRYDPQKGTFMTYARHYIRGFVYKFLGSIIDDEKKLKLFDPNNPEEEREDVSALQSFEEVDENKKGRREVFLKGLEKLKEANPKAAEVVMYHFIHEKSYYEIAKIMQETEYVIEQLCEDGIYFLNHDRDILMEIDEDRLSEQERYTIKFGLFNTKPATSQELLDGIESFIPITEKLAEDFEAKQGLDGLGLTPKMVEMFSRKGITSRKQLKKMSDEELLKIPGMGKKKVETLKERLFS